MSWVKLGMLGESLAACGGQDATSFEMTTEVAQAGATVAVPSEPASGAGAAAPQVIESEHVKTVREPDGSYASTVNATSMASWVYFSLRATGEVTPDAPEQSSSWDLGFQRSNVKVNG